MSWRVLEGDATERLRELDAGSVQTCITSPPYWGLRDYGTAAWDGGDPECDHVQRMARGDAGRCSDDERPGNINPTPVETPIGYRDRCGKCGATRIDSQLGLEPTPEQYVANLVAVFREVRRVLRDDGTVWLNLGDSYAGPRSGETASRDLPGQWGKRLATDKQLKRATTVSGMKPKDLVGIPWAVAKALQAPYYTGMTTDERDRIWLAAMIDAEGCMFIHRRKAGQSNGQGYFRKSDSFGSGLEVASTDRVIVERCLAIVGKGSISEQSPKQNPRRKQTIYRWNLRTNECRDVVREVYPYLTAKQHEARLLCGVPSSGEKARAAWEALKSIHQGGEHPDIDFPAPESMFERGWFLRSDIVWSKKPNPMPESVTDRPTRSHEYLFLLTKSAKYWYDADAIREAHTENYAKWTERYAENGRPGSNRETAEIGQAANSLRNKRSVWTVATQPFPGAHFATFPPKLIEPCVLAGSAKGDAVLDCFAGAGTTGVVALRHDRDFVGVELNPEYAEMARNRIRDDAPLLNGEEAYSVPKPTTDKQSATGQQQLSGGDRMSGFNERWSKREPRQPS